VSAEKNNRTRARDCVYSEISILLNVRAVWFRTLLRGRRYRVRRTKSRVKRNRRLGLRREFPIPRHVSKNIYGSAPKTRTRCLRA